MNLNSRNFPAAFAAMDQWAKTFWAYPTQEEQLEFLLHFAQETNDSELQLAVKVFI